MVPLHIIEQIQKACRLTSKEELCGIIDSEDCLYWVRNVAPKIFRHYKFIFDKKEYFVILKKLKELGRSVKCIFHTHPQGDCSPSEADCRYICDSKKHALIVSKDCYRWIEYREISNA